MALNALFVIDCLRYDCFPDWFTHKHSAPAVFNKFESAFNTPLYFNSLMLGCNLYGQIPFNDEAMTRLYYHRPRLAFSDGRSLFEKLRDRGVHCYVCSDLDLVGKLGWWMKYADVVDNSLTHDFKDPAFLLWHTFRAHALQGRIAPADARQQHLDWYLVKVEEAFMELDMLIWKLKPRRWGLMGNHGEEFYLQPPLTAASVIAGHGTFNKPILTDNVRFTGLLLNSLDEQDVRGFESLHNLILKWFEGAGDDSQSLRDSRMG